MIAGNWNAKKRSIADKQNQLSFVCYNPITIKIQVQMVRKQHTSFTSLQSNNIVVHSVILTSIYLQYDQKNFSYQ